ncbi:MAG: N-acetyltransferase [Deltaproteobacteria bacterium]|nr:N-acetyltransferase [Deltaproteobacteria bacterium]
MIELATRADVPAILAIANAAAALGVANLATEPEPLEQWLHAFDTTHERYPWLVVRDRGRVVAFAKAGPHKARGAYDWSADVTIYVDPAFHRKGLGRRLYGVLVPLMRAQGFATLVAGISLPNAASEALHEAFGFVRCATFERIGYKAGRWHSVGYWENHLHTDADAPGAIRSVREAWSETEADV